MGSNFYHGDISRRAVELQIDFGCGNPNACLVLQENKAKAKEILEVLKVSTRNS